MIDKIIISICKLNFSVDLKLVGVNVCAVGKLIGCLRVQALVAWVHAKTAHHLLGKHVKNQDNSILTPDGCLSALRVELYNLSVYLLQKAHVLLRGGQHDLLERRL